MFHGSRYDQESLLVYDILAAYKRYTFTASAITLKLKDAPGILLAKANHTRKCPMYATTVEAPPLYILGVSTTVSFGRLYAVSALIRSIDLSAKLHRSARAQYTDGLTCPCSGTHQFGLAWRRARGPSLLPPAWLLR